MGFKTRTRHRHDPLTGRVVGTEGGKPLIPRELQRIIQRPIYSGISVEKWTGGKGVRCPFPGLVKIELFNRANKGKLQIVEGSSGIISIEQLAERKPRQLENPDYPYRFVVRCPHCRSPFKGSASRGKLGKRYPGYHCSRGHKYFRVPSKKMHAVVESYVENLDFKKEYLDLFCAVALDVWRMKREHAVDNEGAVQDTVQQLEEQQDRLLTQLTATESDVVKSLIEKKIEELEDQIEAASSCPAQGEISLKSLESYLARARKVVEHPMMLLAAKDNHRALQQSWSYVFEELPTFEEVDGGTPKLSVAFRYSQGCAGEESQLVALLSREWNTFVKQVRNGCNIPMKILQV